MTFTHYQKAGDKVFAVNPWIIEQKGPFNVIGGDNVAEYQKFNQWLSTKPPICADPSIKDGVYKVEELEIVWQMYDDNPGYEDWTTSKKT